MRTARILAPLALLAALALTGCADDPADFGSDDQAGSDDGGGGGAGGDAEVREVDPEDAVAEVTYDAPPRSGLPEGSTVTVGVHALEVADGVMLLQLSYTPDVASGDDAWSLYDLNGGNPIQPTLLDTENLQEYSLIRGETLDRPSWSIDVVTAKGVPGETVTWWGYYAPAADGVETLDIQVHPGLPLVDDVPVTR